MADDAGIGQGFMERQFPPEIARDLGLARAEPIRAFEPEEYSSRLRKVRQAMEDQRVDLLVLSSPAAMCWLHGYQSRWYNGNAPTEWPSMSCSAVHVDHDRIITFEVESHQDLLARTSVSEDNRLMPEDPSLDAGHGFIASELRKEGWLRGRCGMEKYAHKPSPFVSEHLEGTLARDVEVVDATGLIRGVQRIKSAAEIGVIREAARICDAGLNRLAEVLRPEMTELEAWGEMMLAMAREGGEPAAIHEVVFGDDLIAGGHLISSARPVGEGMTVADPCGVRHRYHANTCRSFWVGDDPPDSVVRLAEACAGAFDVLADVARPGTSFADVSRRLREYYDDAGIWDMRGWIGGYELGISFPPDWVNEFVFNVEEDEEEKFVEPGLVTNYESVAGVSLIETMVFLEEGNEALSSVPRKLIMC